MKYLLYFLLILFANTNLQAQTWCASQTTKVDPTVKVMPTRSKTVITIPVVVHVLWAEEEQNISDEQIASQIEILNQDFRALTPNQGNIYQYYQDKIADMEINFELATTDCNGNSTNGIIHEEVPPSIWDESINGQRKICYTNLGGSSAWCTSCYLNIWVVGEMAPISAAGRGIFPTELGNELGQVPFEEDGIYIRHNRFGTMGTASTAPYHLGKTLTHEIGHYLNLLHPWGANVPGSDCNPSACCNQPAYDDFVEDTEFQIKTYLNQCPTGFQQSCDNPDNYQNFMCWSDDPCLLMFTPDQKARAWDALMTYRPGLLKSACVVATHEAVDINQWIGNTWIDGSYLNADIKTPSSLSWAFYDIQGRIIAQWQSSFTGLQRQLLPDLATGIYLLKLKKGKQFAVKKMVVY